MLARHTAIFYTMEIVEVDDIIQAVAAAIWLSLP
jgi:hypothetical protein